MLEGKILCKSARLPGRGFFNRFIIITITIATTSASSAMLDSKFLADLVEELVPLPTSASSARSDGKFLADWVGVVLSIEISDLADLLKPWMKC